MRLVAPLKALCNEKFKEWSGKFERSLKLKCIELTGDTDQDEENVFHLVQSANIICTTPVSLCLSSLLESKRFYLSFVKGKVGHCDAQVEEQPSDH